MTSTLSRMSASPSYSSSSFDCLEKVSRRPVEMGVSSGLQRVRLVPGEGVLTGLEDGAVVTDDVEGMRNFPGVEKLGKDPSEMSWRVNPD